MSRIKAPLRTLNGYLCVYLPDHPCAMTSLNWMGYIYEHIVIAEEFLKRKLTPTEVVHHLDSKPPRGYWSKHSSAV